MLLAQLHLVAVGFWLGMVAAETVLEFCGRDAASRRTVEETDVVRVGAMTRQVKMTGLAIPFAIVALVIGLGLAP